MYRHKLKNRHTTKRKMHLYPRLLLQLPDLLMLQHSHPSAVLQLHHLDMPAIKKIYHSFLRLSLNLPSTLMHRFFRGNVKQIHWHISTDSRSYSLFNRVKVTLVVVISQLLYVQCVVFFFEIRHATYDISDYSTVWFV